MKYPVYAYDTTHWITFNPKTERYFYTHQTVEDIIRWASMTAPQYGNHMSNLNHLTFLFEIDPDDYPEYRI